MASNTGLSPQFVGQEYQVGYLQIQDNLMTEVQSIRLTRTDGGADVETLARDWAGRVKGAAKSTINFSGVVPFLPPDTQGAAFASGGMVAGPLGGGPQLDQTILTNLNSNGNQPVKFTFQVGATPGAQSSGAQTMVFKGYINNIVVDTAVGKQMNFSCDATGQFCTAS